MITIALSIVIFLLTCASVVLLILWLDARKKGVKYRKVSDLDAYSQSVANELNEQVLNLESYKKELAKLKQSYQSYSQVVGILKSHRKHIKSSRNCKAKLPKQMMFLEL